MTSPVVWMDGFQRASAAMAPFGIPVLDAMTQATEDQQHPWVLFEVASADGDRLGVGEIVDEETGQIWLHLFVPRGSGALPALERRKALSVAFRVPDGAAPEGLYYDGKSYDPPDSDQEGKWVRFSLAVTYRYQDIVLPLPSP